MQQQQTMIFECADCFVIGNAVQVTHSQWYIDDRGTANALSRVCQDLIDHRLSHTPSLSVSLMRCP